MREFHATAHGTQSKSFLDAVSTDAASVNYTDTLLLTFPYLCSTRELLSMCYIRIDFTVEPVE